MKIRVGIVTIGQAPREDVVPDMAELMGPGAEILEGGALDGLTREEIERLAPEGDHEVLVTRLTDGRRGIRGQGEDHPARPAPHRGARGGRRGA